MGSEGNSSPGAIRDCTPNVIGIAQGAQECRLVSIASIATGQLLFRIEGETAGFSSRHSLQIGENLHLHPGLSGADRREDGTLDRFAWRFLNHSCHPNVRIRGQDVIALRPIAPLEELTFDYNTTEYDMAAPFTCRCGGPDCLGEIRGFRHLSTSRQRRLIPLLAPHLRDSVTLLQDIFVRAARRWPGRVAVETPPGQGRPERGRTTYAELDRKSDILAGVVGMRLSGESVVGILLPRGEPLYAAQLAVLKAGAAYTCLNASFPDERLREILEDSAASTILTDAAGSGRLRDIGIGKERLIDAGGELAACEEPASITPGSRVTTRSLAYLVYTSGSAGRPKGVMVEHRSIVNLVAGDMDEFHLSPDDRVGQSSSAAYDSSVEEMWLAFAAGATVVVMDDDTARMGPDLIPWLRRERITVWCPPPTLLRATGCDDPEHALPDLKLLYVGGEPLPQDLARSWAPGRQLVNGYGPTECTVTCLRGRIEVDQPVTIGQPIEGVSAWVLDGALNEAARGEHGELCVGGAALARGYWKQPELTRERFVMHPSLGRIYRTGDQVHRAADGRYYYHGRLDSQIKIRGYRIELGEIESRLAECAGVRAAACAVVEDSGAPGLAAFIVPDDLNNPPTAAALRLWLESALPAYMVPSRYGILPELPTTVGGKLDRARLPRIDSVHSIRPAGQTAPPLNEMESRLETAVRDILGLRQPVSIHDDFFKDLGGDSLSAARLVTLLRADPFTAWVSVRDIFEARTVAELAKRERASGGYDSRRIDESSQRRGRPLLVTFLQAAWLLAMFTLAAASAFFGAFSLLPWLNAELGVIPLILLAPALALVARWVYVPVSALFAVAVKRLLIGRYRPLRAPVWGNFYLRNWIAQEAAGLIPWRMLEGTVFQQTVLRALGARIGRRVHIHRGVDLRRGGWDLLEIGDDATIGQDAAIRLVELDEGAIVVGPVVVGERATLETRAGMAGHTAIEPDACLTALSSLPAEGRIPGGERWDGVPARPAGRALPPPPLDPNARLLTPGQHGLLLALARAGTAVVLSLPAQALAVIVYLGVRPEGRVNAAYAWGWLLHLPPNLASWLAGVGIVALAAMITLAWTAVAARMLGSVPLGTMVRLSPDYVRVWLKTGMVESAGKWLSGTLFWPLWLRLAGMRVGRGCEISTIVDVVPEHIDIGPDTFLADGIYLGGPRIQQGTVTTASTRLGRNTFLGNHVVVPGGQQLPDDILLGICTVADDRSVRTATSWFGHPPFELPRREVVQNDRRLTHDPSWIRYWNRVFWELLRLTVPMARLLVLLAWFRILAGAGAAAPHPVLLLVYTGFATVGVGTALCLFVLALKWTLLGRVRPGLHPLWSCWCSRWDFLYVVWGQLAAPVLQKLEGTLMLSWYLRAMGMKLGKRVVLGPGFAQVVDPDMIEIEDEATVNAMFQAHTFEDRVLKIDRVRIRRGATLGSASAPLYGADIGAGTRVAAHSVIMKRERLLPGLRYEGVPTRAQ